MEENANYIPLGSNCGKIEKAEPVTSFRTGVVWGPKVIGNTAEERKAIAREIRLKARKEKKKIKAEAKAARKVNAALHRKLNRNTEKYNKNRERNKQREIDLERQKIRTGAVRQAEALAAIHDPTGKSFNVGEIIVLPGGKVKTKEGLRKAAEEQERKKREDAAREAVLQRYKNAEAAAQLEAEEAQRAEEQGRPAPTHFPAKEALSKMKRPKKLSKKQLQKQEQLKPKPVPPKPIIPEGISLPDGEENLLALWDITDDDIRKRLAEKKKEKAANKKNLIRIQKEAKKFNKAMKAMKKEADSAGVIFDKAAAKKKILEAQALSAKKKEGEEEGEPAADSNAESNSDSESGSESDSDSDTEEAKAEKIERPETNSKRAAAPTLDNSLVEQAAELERAQKAEKQAAKERRRQERKEKKAEEAKMEEEQRLLAAKQAKKQMKAAKKAAKLAVREEPTKRKRSDDDGEDHAPQKKKSKSLVEPEVEESAVKKSRREAKEAKEAKLKVEYEALQEHDSKKKEGSDGKLDRIIAEREAKIAAEASDDEERSRGAEQWHPEKLSGDAARKDKFLRLLGAGKGASKESEKKGKKEKKVKKQPGVDIDKVALDLERQFEAGNKMKHDGGGKRRGLGA